MIKLTELLIALGQKHPIIGGILTAIISVTVAKIWEWLIFGTFIVEELLYVAISVCIVNFILYYDLTRTSKIKKENHTITLFKSFGMNFIIFVGMVIIIGSILRLERMHEFFVTAGLAFSINIEAVRYLYMCGHFIKLINARKDILIFIRGVRIIFYIVVNLLFSSVKGAFNCIVSNGVLELR